MSTCARDARATQISVQTVVSIDITETVSVGDQMGLVVETPLFTDGFESGDTTAWTVTVSG